jgi:DNA transformation protein
MARHPSNDDLLAELLPRLEPLGAVRAKRMFGGVGLYCDERFFGVIDEGVLYFKVDAESIQTYQAAGSAPFRPVPDKPAMLGYWEVPLRVQESDVELRAWARRALVVEPSKKSRRKPKPAKARAHKAAPIPVERLRNLGPKSSAWLRSVGIETRADLERVGAVAAYKQVAAAGFETSLNLLYALEGALLDLRWDRLSAAIKENLRDRASR